MGSGQAELIPQSTTSQASAGFVAPEHDQSGGAPPGDLQTMVATTMARSPQTSPSKRSAQTPASQTEDEEIEAVQLPSPKMKGRKQGSARAPRQHAPTVDDILAPEEPAFEKATTQVLKGSIVRVVTDLYDKVLAGELQTLKVDLAKTKPPPPTPLADKLLGILVDEIATWALGSIGKIVAKEVFGKDAAAAEVAKASRPRRIPRNLEEKKRQQQAQETAEAVSAVSPPRADKTPGELQAEGLSTKAANATGDKLREGATQAPAVAPDAAATSSHLIPGSTLLETFISLENGSLLAQKERAILMIETMMSSAAARGAELAELDAALLNALDSPQLRAWFHYKVTMEWVNFVAKVSIGAPAEGQTTTMPGANEIDGISAAGRGAARTWQGAEGFVEITLRLPDRIDGLNAAAVQNVSLPSSFGAANKLKDLASIPDGSVRSYSLATLPVFRRVWLKAGDSAMAQAPAVVITPDGKIEFDANNPALAAVGSMRSTELGDRDAYYLAGTDAMTAEQRRSPDEWLKRATHASQAQVGAHMIYAMLAGVSPGAIAP